MMNKMRTAPHVKLFGLIQLIIILLLLVCEFIVELFLTAFVFLVLLMYIILRPILDPTYAHTTNRYTVSTVKT